jgi:aryl-alcohol dehydrogenase-like predicted oxidoreductase
MNKPHQKTRIGRREFIRAGAMTAFSVPFLSYDICTEPQKDSKVESFKIKPEWRNRQEGMTYRQLGRTGFMVSEMVFGTERIKPDNIRPIEMAIERGLNYLDTAPQYGRGASESAIGKALNSSSKREKVFIATKLSSFPAFRNNLYKEIFDGLPSGKKESIQHKALELRKNSGMEIPGYYIIYWPGMQSQPDGVFLSDAMMEEYGEKVEGNPGFKKMIISSVEESLKRAGTDYFDILHCPHSATSPHELNNPFIVESFNELKKQGKVRYLGFSTHQNMAALLNSAIGTGIFDVVMLAYNVINYGFLDHIIRKAKENDIGIIAMKAAMAVSTPYPPDQVPVPEWRIKKLNQIIPGEMKLPVKAFLWALQNPDISAVNAGILNEEMLIEDLSVVGKKAELKPA